MKIYILGLPGSGKTTFARTLANQYAIPHIELDHLFHHNDGLHRIRRHYEDIQTDLSIQLATHDWIAEGIYPLADVYNLADHVVILQDGILKCLYRQWIRFFKDPRQRDRVNYGILTNIGLSSLTVGLALNMWGVKVYRAKARVNFQQFFKTVGVEKVIAQEQIEKMLQN